MKAIGASDRATSPRASCITIRHCKKALSSAHSKSYVSPKTISISPKTIYKLLLYYLLYYIIYKNGSKMFPKMFAVSGSTTLHTADRISLIIIHLSGYQEQPLGSEAIIDFDRAKVLRGIELTLGPAPATTSGDDTQTRSAVRVNILVGESVICARNVLLRL